jgi:Fur family ferric uptake transcriptional regulator
VSDWIERADAALRQAGRRAGGARTAVLVLLDRQDCCLSAQEIHDRLRGDRPVGLASVYRALDQLAAAQLVQRVDVGDGVLRYEPARGDEHHHHHIVCHDCGKVEPFHDLSLEHAVTQVSQRIDHDVSNHEILLRGACPDCRDR